MDLNGTALMIGQRAVSWGELALAAAALAFLLLLLTLVMSWRAARHRRAEHAAARRHARELEHKLSELSGHLRQQAEAASARDAHISRMLSERLDSVSARVGQGLQEQAARTSEHLKRLAERLAVIDQAQANITRLSGEVVSLQHILADKQTRGAFGQARMEAIIEDALPAGLYEFQATLSNGSRPDCLIRMPDSELKAVIDAKFPLEAFEAIREAESEAGHKRAVARLRTDITRHIRDISGKYLIPGETLDTAIMFVPSESIYAELYENHDDLIARAHKARVILASPNVLMLMVQTMQAIYKDARMREAAGLIQREVGMLMADVERLHRRVLDLQRHFGRAETEIDKLLISSEKIIKRGAKIENLELDDAPALTRETDGAGDEGASPESEAEAPEPVRPRIVVTRGKDG